MGKIVMQEYKRKIEPDEVEEFPVFLYRGEITWWIDRNRWLLLLQI